MLWSLRNLERPKDQYEDENVVDAERFLDQIPSEECDSGLRPTGEVNVDGEQEGKDDPCRALNEGSAKGDLLRFAMEDSEVENQCCGDDNCEDDPNMNWGSEHYRRV